MHCMHFLGFCIRISQGEVVDLVGGGFPALEIQECRRYPLLGFATVYKLLQLFR